MKKLAMNLDALAVETFETVKPELEARGTVQGQGAAPSYIDFTRCHTNCSCPVTW